MDKELTLKSDCAPAGVIGTLVALTSGFGGDTILTLRFDEDDASVAYQNFTCGEAVPYDFLKSQMGKRVHLGLHPNWRVFSVGQF